MASFTNSFSALLDDSEAVVNAVEKRRKNVKQQESLGPLATTLLASLQTRNSSESSSSGPALSQPDVNSLENLVAEARSHRSRRTGMRTPTPTMKGGPSPQASSAASEPLLGPRITSEEASHIVEQAANGMKGPHRLRLWSEWLAQLQELAGGYGVRYSGPNNSLVDFRQILLRSRALEMSVEGCLSEALSESAEPLLAQVLRALLAPHLSPTLPAAIAARVVQLSGLAAADSEPARRAAAGAVSTLVGALKAQPAGEDPGTEQLLSRAVAKAAAVSTTLEDINERLAAEEAALALTITWKDKARQAGAVLDLSEQRLALMASSSADRDTRLGDPSSAALQEASHSLALWRSQVQKSQRSAALVRSSAQMQGQQRHAQGAAWRQQDAQLALAQAELAAEIQARQDQLRRLLQRSAALEEQRRMLAREQSGGGQDSPSSAAHRNSAAYDEQLAAAHSFHQMLQAASSAIGSVQSRGGDSEPATHAACAAYMQAVQCALEANHGYLLELLRRTQDTGKQLVRVRKQGQDLARAGISESAPDNSRQQERLAARVQDGVRAAAEVWLAARGAEQGIHRYGVLLSRLPPSVGNAVGGIQELVLRMEAAYAAVREAAAEPPAPSPRRRTPGELVELLATSRVDEPPPLLPPAPATLPAVRVEKTGSASAPIEDPTAVVMARLACLEAELASTRRQLCNQAGAASPPAMAVTWHEPAEIVAHRDDARSAQLEMKFSTAMLPQTPVRVSAFQMNSLQTVVSMDDPAVDSLRASSPLKSVGLVRKPVSGRKISSTLESKSSATAAAAVAAALSGIRSRGIKS